MTHFYLKRSEDLALSKHIGAHANGGQTTAAKLAAAAGAKVGDVVLAAEEPKDHHRRDYPLIWVWTVTEVVPPAEAKVRLAGPVERF